MLKIDEWTWDARSETWLWGKDPNYGCGVFEDGGWQGNVVYYYQILAIETQPSREEAMAKCLEQYYRLDGQA